MSLRDQIEAEAEAVDALEGVDDLALWLADAKEAAKALAILIADNENELAARMPDKQVEVPGLGVVEKHKKVNSVRWDSDRLYDLMWTLPDPREALKACAPLTASLGWRRSALKKLGIDPDDYCERSWLDRYRIQIHGDAS